MTIAAAANPIVILWSMVLSIVSDRTPAFRIQREGSDCVARVRAARVRHSRAVFRLRNHHKSCLPWLQVDCADGVDA
jgi:hypothetical protein